MSNPNFPTQAQNDAKYATPTSVTSAIAAQATMDAGQYLTKPTTGQTQGKTLVGLSSTTSQWVTQEAWVDAFGADPTGASDSTAAINAAIAWLTSNGSYRGVVCFGPGIYKFGGVALGTVAASGGRNYYIKGAGQQRTILQPRSASEIMLTFNGGADNSGDTTVLEDFTMVLPTARQDYVTPVLKFVNCRNFRISRVGMDAGQYSYAGTFAYFDASYSMSWRDSYWYVGKKAVPVEIDSQTANPNSGSYDQVDTWSFDNILHGGCGPLTVRKGNATEAHGLTLRNYKAAITTWYPNATAVTTPSTITSAATVGATTITMTDASTYVADDGILIGTAETAEMNYISSISGSVITLGKPLRYAQAALTPVIRGGAALSTGTINLVAIEGAHWENQWAGVLLGSCNEAKFDRIYMGASYNVALVGNCRNLVFNQHLMVGTSLSNTNLYTPTSSWNTPTSGWGPFIVNGPFQKQSGAANTPGVEPSSGTVMTVPWKTLKQLDYSSAVSNFQDHWHAPSLNSDKVQRVTYGSAVTETAYVLVSGRAYYSDAVATKDVGAIDSKTSANIDALFTATPIDGTTATGTLSGTQVLLIRGSSKWNYVNMTQIT